MRRKREPRACDTCRNRKIRCDISTTGLSCSNCSRASTICSVSNAWGKRAAHSAGRSIVPLASIHTFRVGVSKADSAIGEDGNTVVGLTSGHDASEVNRHDVRESHSSGIAVIPLLPDYITPLPKNVDPDVLHLLHQKGALTLPQKDVVDELLRAFVCYVYPSLPVVDLDEILNAMSSGTSGNTISLLLFQAVLMAGVAFADSFVLQCIGFRSWKDAQRIFFERVKILYELDVEANPTMMVQVLLLMSCVEGRPDEINGRFYWLGIARSLATAIGLDNDLHDSDQPDQQRFHRRLWACYIMMSHLLSLTDRRPIPLHCVARSLEALRADDYGDVTLSRALDEFDMPGHDVEAKFMGQLFIQQIKLCVIIRNTLQTQYESSSPRRVRSGDALMVLVPKTKASSVEVIARDQELREWYRGTSAIKEAAFGQDHRSNGKVLAVGALQKFSQLTLRYAAKRITEIGRKLADDDLVRFMPSSAVGAFIAASVQHLEDTMSTDSELRSTGSLYLIQTLHAFAAWREKYNSVDSAIAFIEGVKSSEISFSSFAFQDLWFLMTRWDGETASYATGEADVHRTADAGALLQLGIPGGGVRSNRRSGRQGSNGPLDTPYLVVPNLEGFSEELISSMYRSQGDSATG
ncbi:hypothetical protein H2200_001586 [Cladophialophora chaetospira]|uniref:Zn(2)-C6 fungal-type domain-containing protein n=1 Tax=Cladophialophora chaetospira TaxID=386627 RepID=A0AA38XL95_9EURO|nr:hypothetical protein H2200_001586 [Cladophialophora chaetospira]